MAGGIGHVLRDARRNLGVTLTEAAQRTRVRETHLAALERDELESIGIDPVYVRGIIRTYAEYLGLDSAALLARYRAQRAPQPTGRRGAPGIAGEDTNSSRSRRWLAPIAAAALLLVVLAGAAAAVVTLGDGPAGTEKAATAGRRSAQPSTEQPVSEAASEPVLLDIPQGQGPTPKGLTVKLEFTDKVWIRVLVDGRNQLEGIMRPGAVTQFTADEEIELRLGVADAVEFSLNGAWYGEVASDFTGPVDVRCDSDASCRVTQVG